ncbi:MAG: ribonuclease III [Betaproteobacteria bacterium]|nr:ribonuclease III [Betaproteobacteria bacterium]
MDLSATERGIGYRFREPALLRQALTHRSHSASHNERLEFLGDSVLNCVIAALLYERFPRLSEGELSRTRASLVNQESLFNVAQTLKLGDALQLGEGELRSGGARRPSILADALEAVIGAVFVDGQFEAARDVVAGCFSPLLAGIDPRTQGKDPKTQLQEYLQGRRLALPRYSVIATTGEAHDQRFDVECAIDDLGIRSRGEGSSRRAAEQAAARAAYARVTGRE